MHDTSGMEWYTMVFFVVAIEMTQEFGYLDFVSSWEQHSDR